MNKLITKDKYEIVPGRPSIVTNAVVKKLEHALRRGASITEACSYAEISRQVFYYHMHVDEDFFDTMCIARDSLKLNALENIYYAIQEGDLRASMWYLSKWVPFDISQREAEIKDYRKTEEFAHNLYKTLEIEMLAS
ncbi:hypothetical protein H6802_00440 [Candidatus Nomurabacteria bacterium]|uniref:Uncharacterized protein n=1 Tax=candidate division WWE3 bacterium TaxID=2053526 RepID=A0A955E1G5_UNCKA|nr:hypothetical protein [candidate division WWE3 bacterium]MCB9823417.1 hypothetical protein [Candidatus Nomurabacteria bacterium]MCB9827699.1 hypothetical protein [Candidatus Nomurabacteria bacterium]HXK52837.1 hypothetical protein [bacterium]